MSNEELKMEIQQATWKVTKAELIRLFWAAGRIPERTAEKWVNGLNLPRNEDRRNLIRSVVAQVTTAR